MNLLEWDQSGERHYETGVDRGVLYLKNELGVYEGVAWNGLTTVTEAPGGAEPTPIYADNIKYLTLMTLEELAGTIEAFTYPDEFAECDGSGELAPGVIIAQQKRTGFGFAYRTKLGNDVDENAHGYKLHLVYGAVASPSEKAYATINDSPEAITFSWEFTTTPVDVTDFTPTALVVIDSTKVAPADLAELEVILYGLAASVDPVVAEVKARLPLPDEIATLFTPAG